MFSVTSEPNANISFRSDPPRASGPADGSQPNGFATLVDDNATAATQNDRSAQSPPPAVARQDNSPSPPPPSRETAADTDSQSSRGDPSQKPDRDAPQSKVDNPGKRGRAPVKSEAAKGKADTAASASNPGTSASTARQAASQIQPDAIAVPPVVAAASTDTVPVSDASGSSSPLKIAAAAIAASAKVAAAADTPSPVASSARDSASTVSAGDSAAVTEAVAAAASDIAATNFKIAKDIETAPAPVVAKAAADAAETLDAQQKLGVAIANPTDALVKTTLKASTSERHDDAATAVAKALNPDSSTAAPSSTPQPTNDGANAQPVAAAHPKSNDAEVKPKPDGVDGNAAANSTTAAPAEHRGANAGTQPASMPFDPGSQTSALPQPQVLPTTTPAAVPASQLTAALATSVAVPLNGLAVQIAATAQGGRSRFEIRLDPAELGRIDVRLDVDRHGQVTSHLVVEKPETLAMLRQDAPQLQRALEDAGLKTGNNGLQFSLRDQSSSGNQNGDNHSNRNTQHLIVGDTESLPSAVVGKSYGPATGSTRGLDIRV